MCCSSGGYNLRKCGHAVLQSGSIAASTGSAILPKTRPRRPLPPPPPQQPSSSAVRCIKCEYYNQSINGGDRRRHQSASMSVSYFLHSTECYFCFFFCILYIAPQSQYCYVCCDRTVAYYKLVMGRCRYFKSDMNASHGFVSVS